MLAFAETVLKNRSRIAHREIVGASLLLRSVQVAERYVRCLGWKTRSIDRVRTTNLNLPLGIRFHPSSHIEMARNDVDAFGMKSLRGLAHELCYACVVLPADFDIVFD